mmetsp:Transcript_26433/g.70649  ORF Transcript_26433/g.70649 Transcript_26433/m.70649 type:complete len:285 (+) Transcript_26433:870-1724(+)
MEDDAGEVHAMARRRRVPDFARGIHARVRAEPPGHRPGGELGILGLHARRPLLPQRVEEPLAHALGRMVRRLFERHGPHHVARDRFRPLRLHPCWHHGVARGEPGAQLVRHSDGCDEQQSVEVRHAGRLDLRPENAGEAAWVQGAQGRGGHAQPRGLPCADRVRVPRDPAYADRRGRLVRGVVRGQARRGRQVGAVPGGHRADSQHHVALNGESRHARLPLRVQRRYALLRVQLQLPRLRRHDLEHDVFRRLLDPELVRWERAADAEERGRLEHVHDAGRRSRA